MNRINPLSDASWPSYLFSTWSFEVIWKASNGEMEEFEAYRPRYEDSAEINKSRILEKDLLQQGVFIGIVKCYAREIIFIIIISMLQAIAALCVIFLTIRTVDLIALGNGVGLEEWELIEIKRSLFGMVVLNTLDAFCNKHLQLMINRTTLRFRAGITSLINKRLLKMSFIETQTFTPGKLSTIIMKDIPNLEEFIESIGNFPTQLFQMIIILAILWSSIGVGVFVLILLITIVFTQDFIFLWVLSIIAKHYLTRKDKRVQMIKKLIDSIRTIKMEVLELFYSHKLKAPRSREIKELVKYQFVFLAQMLIQLSLGDIVKITLLGFSILYVQDTNRSTLNSLILYFDPFINATHTIGGMILKLGNSLASRDRLNEFLLSNKSHFKEQSNLNPNSRISLYMNDASFKWEKGESNLGEQQEPSLSECRQSGDEPLLQSQEPVFNLYTPELKIEKGELVLILGGNGSGKSTLIYSMLGETVARGESTIRRNGLICYLAQTPTIFPLSIMENIVLGENIEQKRLIKALQLADFLRDVSEMEEGLDTVCEENGVNLSGGQRSRLALARCFYQKSDVLIMDDPLKALDAKISKKILEQSICKEIKHKTRIISSNDYNIAKYADRVIVLEAGIVVYNGEPKLASSLPCFQGIDLSKRIEISPEYEEQSIYNIPTAKKKAIEIEKMQLGRISMKTFYITMKEFDGLLGFPILLLVSLGLFYLTMNLNINTIKFANDYTEESDIQGLQSLSKYIVWIIVLQLIFVIILVSLTYRFAKRIHFKMLFSLLHSKVAEFIDMASTGMILNRFTNDLDQVERQLISLFTTFIFLLMALLFGVFVFVTLNYSILSLILFILYVGIVWFSQNISLKAINNLLRKQLIKLSPIIETCVSTRTGLLEIRAMSKERYITGLSNRQIDSYISYSLLYFGVQTMFAFYMNILNLFILVIPSYFFIYGYLVFKTTEKVNLGELSIFLNQISIIGRMIVAIIVLYNQIENKLVSMERCKEIVDLPHEEGYKDIQKEREEFENFNAEQILEKHRETQRMQLNNGSLEMVSISAKYPTLEQHSIFDMSCRFMPREKIAIVGRSGAGKSTLVKLLWKAVQPSEGIIRFGGQNIEDIDLKKLRASIGIVSQENSLIDGTLLDNIDVVLQMEKDLGLPPSSPKEELAIKLLKELGYPLPDQISLSHPIGGSTETQSIGHIQLISLVREMLRKKRIIIFDEITSSFDTRTEKVFFKASEKHFSSSTVVIISHRLETAMKCDKIMVIERGSIVEFGTPANLINDPKSEFYSLSKCML